MGDAWRLAFGTLTVLRVPAPRVVDRAVGGRAMTVAPLVGLVLGLLAAGAGLIADALELSPLVVAVLVVGVLALLTRGLHLDGLADTADGLGSGRRGSDALAVMSRSDIGPFGVVTLLLVLLLEVAALDQLWSADRALGAAAVVVAAVASRAALPLLCRRSVPAAKTDGLGSVVASSVSTRALVTGLLGAFALVAVVGAIGAASTDPFGGFVAAGGPGLLVSYDTTGIVDIGAGTYAWHAVVAAGAALGLVALLVRRCVSRFGGVTGDVLGAGVEITFATSLIVVAALTA